jgi:hypothetical protein
MRSSKKHPKRRKKNWFKRKPLRNEIGKTPKRKGKKWSFGV